MKLLKWGAIGGLGYLTWLVVTSAEFIFIDYFNLLMHEAGHLIFMIGGEIPSFLGGTIMQLLVPIICGITLIRQQHDWWGGGLCLWWLGENTVNVGRYMGDALTQQLPLIGGMHDWVYLFSRWGNIHQAPLIGNGVMVTGILIMGIAIMGLIMQLLAVHFVTNEELNHYGRN